MRCRYLLLSSLCFLSSLAGQASASKADAEVSRILGTYCYTCHSKEEQDGELDLESSDIFKEPLVWEHVLEQIDTAEMPPKKAEQMSVKERNALTSWIRSTLDKIALSNAGNPGPVVLRRLSNVEYTYTLRDLTGISILDPARDFPVDGAAGEGFTNVGAALVMSPGLLTKYLDAAKEVSAHAVFTPHGFRWSPSNSPLDWTNETLTAIQDLYARYTVKTDGTEKVVDGVKLDTGTGDGKLPLQDYLDALQGRRSKDGLSPKYLNLLEQALRADSVSAILDPMRSKFREGKLHAIDFEPWQASLWKFGYVGHLAPTGGQKIWQEPVTPIQNTQEHRVKLSGSKDHTLYLVSGDAGDGSDGDQLIWENARLVGAGRQDLPISHLSNLVKHLESERGKILASTEAALNAISGHAKADTVEPTLLDNWRDYFGLKNTSIVTPLKQKSNSIQNHGFIKGWRAENALSILSNRSDETVRIPGLMQPHSVAMHPAPDRDAVIAWKCENDGKVNLRGSVVRAHTGCGSGVTWALEVRRGKAVERLASGIARNANLINFGPFENVNLKKGQLVALLIGPNNGSHTCGLATVNLHIQQQNKSWDLAKDVAPHIVDSNPYGPWHFLSQPTATSTSPNDLPAPMVAWRNDPTPALAAKVREHLEKDFPLTHPLFTQAIQQFKADAKAPQITTQSPSVIEIHIPAALSIDTEFVTTARLADPSKGSVQTVVLTKHPETPITELRPDLPVIVGENSNSHKKFNRWFQDFRNLFPISLCYSRIVPVDEGVTLTLYHREDEHLSRLMLTDAEIKQLDRLWEELLFISEAPLKQIDALDQLVQYATQIRAERAVEFEKLRAPVMQAAEDYQKLRKNVEPIQAQTVLDFATKAWRRPLEPHEIQSLRKFTPPMMLTRVLTSPKFLYRTENIPQKTGRINAHELATRLSYFLWSSTPDEELRKLAANGELLKAEVLAQQTQRMLKDPKINRLAMEFGCQWLHVRDVATLDEKSERHFPEFLNIRESMQEEVARFFTDLFQNNRSVLSLLDADYTFVNEALAKHYQLKDHVQGWRRVEGMRELGRGGILGFAATLAKHSGASRTSAILRGTWISETVLGDKLPPPPKGVPVLPDEFPEGLTERELIESHTSDPNCSACHKRIDPYGFALEGFDAIGRARSADTSTELYDGTQVDGLQELREYLLTIRRQDFVKQFCRKLLGYALGRACQLSDRPLLEEMAKGDLGTGTLVNMIVNSQQFLQVRGREDHP